MSSCTRHHHDVYLHIQHNAAVLDYRHPLRRLERHDWRVRRPRLEKKHRGSIAHYELEHRGSVPSTLTANLISLPPLHAFSYPPLRSPPFHIVIDATQLIHSAVLTFASVAAPQNTLAMGLFTAGMTMFSGSIYLLVLDPQRFKVLGPVTPLGGLCLIGGWVALAVGKRPVFPKVR
jgi:hypothetical protein